MLDEPDHVDGCCRVVAVAGNYRVDTGLVLVELRSVPDCPNLDRVRSALRRALTDLGLAPVVIERVGDFPSPSVLVDGVDVLGGGGGSAACRLDLPTAEDITAALRRATEPPGPAARSVTAANCCAEPGDVIRADRPERAARLDPGLRQVHQAILRHFARTGAAPQLGDIASAAARAGVELLDALRQLAADDLIAVDDADRLIAAYPFSPTPTAHTVSLGEVTVFAMCAIDALGIPFMLHTDGTVTSTDPQTGQPVRVVARGGLFAFEPSEAVVVYAASAPTGRSVDSCCSTINFFASPASARTWLADRSQLAANLLVPGQAVQLARDIFEPLLKLSAH